MAGRPPDNGQRPETHQGSDTEQRGGPAQTKAQTNAQAMAQTIMTAAETVAQGDDGRLCSPSATRNAGAIGEALFRLLAGRTGTLIEIGSGTGQHAASIAPGLPSICWLPTEYREAQLASIVAWCAQAGASNVRQPRRLDAAADWASDLAVDGTLAAMSPIAAVFASNVIHIAPWRVAEGLITGAGKVLAAGGMLLLYGPYREGGRHTGEGNARFDATLKARDPDWGVRDLEAVANLARTAGFGAPAITRMPANNLLLAFTRL
ncbi:MAG: DUF938 domain-containing protein [Pseudomonadota bacterium]